MSFATKSNFDLVTQLSQSRGTLKYARAKQWDGQNSEKYCQLTYLAHPWASRWDSREYCGEGYTDPLSQPPRPPHWQRPWGPSQGPMRSSSAPPRTRPASGEPEKKSRYIKPPLENSKMSWNIFVFPLTHGKGNTSVASKKFLYLALYSHVWDNF